MSRIFTAVSLQRIDGLSPGTLDNQQPFSMSLWVLPVSMGPTSGGRFLGKTTQGSAGWRFTWGGQTGTTNNVVFIKGYTTTDAQRVSSDNAAASFKWTHLAATWDSGTSANGIRLYSDGVEVKYLENQSVNGVGTTSSDAVGKFLMGNREGALYSRTFDGAMAHVAFHKRVLTAQEFGQQRMYPGSIDSSTQQGFWPLWSPGAGATTTSSEHDYSGKGNVATATSCLFSASAPPINGMFVIPAPHFAGCA